MLAAITAAANHQSIYCPARTATRSAATAYRSAVSTPPHTSSPSFSSKFHSKSSKRQPNFCFEFGFLSLVQIRTVVMLVVGGKMWLCLAWGVAECRQVVSGTCSLELGCGWRWHLRFVGGRLSEATTWNL
ncbi:hypothetical protein WN943_004669 [Citrus x changshan-huyou]